MTGKDRIRATYPKGTRVELIDCADPYTDLQPGQRGTVSLVDDNGTIHIDWDNGSKLGIVPGWDAVKKITEKEDR